MISMSGQVQYNERTFDFYVVKSVEREDLSYEY